MKQTDDWVNSMVEVFTAPLIVWPSGWNDSLPEWIRGEVTLQRLIRLMKGDDDLATDVEAMAYMYALTLEHPLDSDWVQIYLYLGTTVMGSRMTREGVEFPADISVEKLNSDQERDLLNLKRWIRDRQRKALCGQRAERRTERKTEAERVRQETRGEQLPLLPEEYAEVT